MPRIQIPNQRNAIDVRVPEANIPDRNAGVDHRAAAELGNQIASLGAELWQKRTKAEAENYAFTKEQEDLATFTQKSNELKLNTKAGTKEYSTQMNEFIKQRYEQNLQNAPTDLARDSYKFRAGDLANKWTIESSIYENKRNVDKWQQDTEAGIDLNRVSFQNNPDYHQYGDRLQSITSHIDSNVGTLYDDLTAQQAKQRAAEQLSLGVFDGLKSQERFKEGMSLLTVGKNGETSAVAKALSPEQHKGILNEFMAKQKEKNEMSKSALNSNIQDFQYAAIKNGNVDQKQLNKILAGVASNDSIKPEEKSRIQDTLKAVVRSSQETKALKTMSNQELLNYKSSIDTKTTFNIAERARIKEHVESFRDQLLKQRQEDPVSSVLMNNPVLNNLSKQAQSGDPAVGKEYATQVLAAQERLGIARPRITSKDESSFVAQMITVAPSAAAADVVLQNLKGKYGEYLPRALDEMSKDKTGVTHDYVVASFMPSQQSRISAIDNLRNEKAINENFSKSFQSKPDLKTPLAPLTGDLRAAMLQRTDSAADVGVYNSFQKQIELETKKTLASDPDVSVSKATQRAYDKIVEANYAFVPTVRSTIMVPKQQDGSFNDPDAIHGYVALKSQPEAFKELDVIVPKSYAEKNAAKEWYNYAANNSKWVSNSSLTGIQLMYKKSTTGEFVPMTDSKGRPIEKSFKQIMLDSSSIKAQSKELFKPIALGGRLDEF